MYFYGAISAAAGIIWFFLAPEPPRPESAAPAVRHSVRSSLSHVFHIKGVWLIAIAMMAFAGGNRGVTGYLPLYLRDAGWSPASADGALAALNAAGTAAAIPLTLLSDRMGQRKAILVTGLVATVGSVGLLSIVTGPAAWILAIMAGFFRDLIWAVAATMTVETEGIGPEYAGTAVGIVHSFTRVGYTFAPPAGNALAGISAGMPFVLWAGLSVMALLAFIMVKETGRKRAGVAG
jgi:CP family cyanate transporter-like MFS transporter